MQVHMPCARRDIDLRFTKTAHTYDGRLMTIALGIVDDLIDSCNWIDGREHKKYEAKDKNLTRCVRLLNCQSLIRHPTIPAPGNYNNQTHKQAHTNQQTNTHTHKHTPALLRVGASHSEHQQNDVFNTNPGTCSLKSRHSYHHWKVWTNKQTHKHTNKQTN